MADERDELIEEIERLLSDTDEDNDDCGCVCNHIDEGVRTLIEKARINGVIRYPRP
jgi:hypothetical protein